MPAEKTKTLIVLVNYKRPSDTIECVLSLLKQHNLNWDCVVYENGSGDNSYSSIVNGLLELQTATVEPTTHKSNFTYTQINIANRNRVFIVEGSKNLGFAGGNNAAIRLMQSISGVDYYNYYWLLNNDTIVSESCLDEFINYFQSPASDKVGICGATILYHDNPEIIQCLGGAKYSKVFGLINEIEKNKKYDKDKVNKKIDLDYISGASMFTTQKFISTVGLMEESYFLYFEELDWSIRAARNNFKLGYVSSAVIWHKEGSVLGSGQSIKRSALSEFYGLSSKLKFTRKFYPLYLPTIWIFGLGQLIIRIIRNRPQNARSLLRALLFKKRFKDV
ncbi:glycosyltransferase [Methylophilus methylotrophus]|uniref:glycosyltransferase n=1 Tax=Methylophilus methylotrophus TaxID=17 RepID=UPI000F5A1B9B|nr:glycosyltransferase family 2 protein [Methylophilus methylotrophus]